MARRGQNRDRLLEQGLLLFAQQGFHATGVQEIADASGVPKGSFYNYFDSKEQFAAEVLSRYQEEQCAELEALLTRGAGSPRERLRTLFDRWVGGMCESRFSGSCLAGRLAQELAGEVPEIRPPLERVFCCMRGYVAECVREARQAGELAEGLPAEDLAEFLLNSWQGALQRAKASGDDGPLRVFLAVIFDQILRSPDGAAAGH